MNGYRAVPQGCRTADNPDAIIGSSSFPATPLLRDERLLTLPRDLAAWAASFLVPPHHIYPAT